MNLKQTTEELELLEYVKMHADDEGSAEAKGCGLWMYIVLKTADQKQGACAKWSRQPHGHVLLLYAHLVMSGHHSLAQQGAVQGCLIIPDKQQHSHALLCLLYKQLPCPANSQF